MTDNNKHLVRVGHEFAAAMSDDTPIITIAKMVTELASALDVQSARSDALAAKLNDVCAENAALAAFGGKLDKMRNDLNGEGTGIQGRAEVACQQIALEAAMEEFDAVKTPATDAWVNEQRDAILDAAFEAAKQEVERRFGRTFQDCAWLARRNSDTQMKGAVEMAEWVELYAAQLRGSQV